MREFSDNGWDAIPFPFAARPGILTGLPNPEYDPARPFPGGMTRVT
jgi:hypothetical protein